MKNDKKYDHMLGLIFILLCSVIYFIRVYALDADIHWFDLAQIEPIDEMYYNGIAVNFYNGGIQSVLDGTLGTHMIANAKTFLLPGLITGVSMRLLGNTYTGVRLPYVIMGWITLLLLVYCVRQLTGNKKLRCCIPLLYVLDFNILMLSRAGVTVVPCMLTCLIMYAGYLRWQGLCRTFLLGFWPVISFCMVYMGLPFMLLAGFISTAIEVWQEKSKQGRKKLAGMYLGGVFSGLAVCEATNYILLRQHLPKTILDTLFAHSGKITGSINATLRGYLVRATNYFCGYNFKYNGMILLLFLWVMLLFVCEIKSIWKRKEILFLGTIILCHYLQTLGLSNMSFSKVTITFPMVLLLIAWGIDHYLESGPKTEKRSLMIANMCLACILFLIFCRYHCVHAWPLDQTDTCIMIGTAGIGTLLYIWLLKTRDIKPFVAVCAFSCTAMMFFAGKYVYLGRTYYDKMICQELGEMVAPDAVLIGGFPQAYTLYNNLHESLSEYDHYRGIGYDDAYIAKKVIEYTESDKEVYWLGRETADWAQSSEDILGSDSLYKYELVKTFERVYHRSADVKCARISLYKKVPR